MGFLILALVLLLNSRGDQGSLIWGSAESLNSKTTLNDMAGDLICSICFNPNSMPLVKAFAFCRCLTSEITE
ncbi:hypothetical protein ES319_A02G000100v1 [Gossypium barbadense]|uniref:Uncharacterized protein n=1 Tax=Gossypium barbadense TaxID=3634 RepID=A0A5J5WGV4_GOSBA|nr:hypothetical protein ES319_A02G000100v1 [Gossypium barbadense]